MNKQNDDGNNWCKERRKDGRNDFFVVRATRPKRNKRAESRAPAKIEYHSELASPVGNDLARGALEWDVDINIDENPVPSSAVEYVELEGAWERLERRKRKLGNDLRAGVAVVRDVRSFVALDVNLHEELLMTSQCERLQGGNGVNQDENSDTRCSEVKGEVVNAAGIQLPSFPLDISKLSVSAEGIQMKKQEFPAVGGNTEGLSVSEKEESQPGYFGVEVLDKEQMAEKFTLYLQALLKFPLAVGSNSLADFFAFSPPNDRSASDQGVVENSDEICQEDSRKEIVASGFPGRGTPLERSIYQNNSTQSASPFDGRNFADYMFQGDVDENLVPLPRRESFQHVEHVPAGWWLVWQLRVQTTGPPIDFTVSVNEGSHSDSSAIEKLNKGEGAIIAASDEESDFCVFKEQVGQKSDFVRGSYRCQPKNKMDEDDNSALECQESCTAKYKLAFSNTASMFRGALVQFAVQSVPHEAFKAACKAAEDQKQADSRKQRSPLLREILDSNASDPVVLHVDPFLPNSVNSVEIVDEAKDKMDENNPIDIHDEESIASAISSALGEGKSATEAQEVTGGGEAVVDDEIEGSSVRKNWNGKEVAEKELDDQEAKDRHNMEYELLSLRKEIVVLRTGRLKEELELSRTSSLINELKGEVNNFRIEKEKWTLAKDECDEELTRAAAQAVADGGQISMYSDRYHATAKECDNLKSQITELRAQLPSMAEKEQSREILEDAQSENREARAKIHELNEELSSLRVTNQELKDEFEDFRKTLADDLLNARADADEARMMQRILQGKNRELERALIINATARGNVPHAAKTQSSFLPDQNTILDGTKEEVANVGGQTKRAELSARPPDNDKANFAHNQIDERLILQLAGLEERRKKLLLLRENGTQNLKNAELIRKIENAIAAIETNVRSDSERNDA